MIFPSECLNSLEPERCNAQALRQWRMYGRTQHFGQRIGPAADPPPSATMTSEFIFLLQFFFGYRIEEVVGFFGF